MLAKSGRPAADKKAYFARNVPYTASITPDGNGIIDIVVQAANYTDSRKSGIVRSIKFGEYGFALEAAFWHRTAGGKRAGQGHFHLV